MVEGNEKLKQKINQVLIDFSKNNRKSSYYRKPLKGNWYGHEELQVGGNIRIILRINSENTRAVLEQIGTHSQLNL